MPELSSKDWDVFLSGHPDTHLLQTSAWGDIKAEFGWSPTRIAGEFAGAQILFRPLPLGLTLAYIPRGPVGDNWQPLLAEIDAVCRRHKAILLKIEPDIWESDLSGSKLQAPEGFFTSQHSIQPPRTIVIDLTGDDEQLLGRMKQKTRYNIKLALKKGVLVGASADIEKFYRLMEATSQRDRFGVHSLDYYRRVYEVFHTRGACQMFIAEYDQEPLAGLMAFCSGTRAWYFYGGSSDAHRDRMPAYLLQWEAMRWARTQGCREYDLWGIPDVDENTLEAQFTDRSDGLWGVYRFKRGFGGEVRRTAGPWDRVYQPVLYRFYRWWARRREA